MRKFFVVVLLLTGLTANAQFNWDYGLNVGLTTYMGDIGGPAADPIDVQMARANFGAGLFLRYKMTESFYLKGSFNYIRISGADSLSESPGRRVRNLHFRNAIYELALIPEWHFYKTKDFGRTGRYSTFFNTYLFAGIGAAYHNPQAEDNSGKWVNLRPLETEGETYGSVIPVIPVGLGAHFTFNRRLRIGAEIGVRVTFTDFLDDVSGEYLTADAIEDIYGDNVDPVFFEMQSRVDRQYIENNPQLFPSNYRDENQTGGIRGNPDSRDWYFYGSMSIGYVLKGSSNFYRSRYNYSRGKKRSRRRSRAKF